MIGSLERRLILSQFSEVSLQAIRTALLAFLLVFVRAQPGLVRFNDLDFRFVSIRAHAVAIVSWLALVLLVLILSGELAVYAVIAASAWGTLCLVKIVVVLGVESSRRAQLDE